MLPRKLVPDSLEVSTVVEADCFQLMSPGYPLIMKDDDTYMAQRRASQGPHRAWPFHFELVGWPGRETGWKEREVLLDQDPMEF